MSAKNFVRLAAAVAVFAGSCAAASASITIPMVAVGNAGNLPETTINGSFGAVAYNYNIGATEVTNTQYVAFLNSVAATDTFALYNTSMAGSFGGITRSGSAGSYSYATVSGRENNPVNYVSFWDAARFANWMQNGQPMGGQNNGTTEDGVYTLTSGGIAANTVTRNAGWQWAVSNSNEWYKAAYYQPAAQGGDVDNYWQYPTSSNTAPTGTQANYLPSGIGNTTAVASYAANFYGCYDMAGNVYELSDTIPAGPFRGLLFGGAYDNIAGWLTPANAILTFPASEREQIGFRMVSVPGPASFGVLALGGLIAGRRRR